MQNNLFKGLKWIKKKIKKLPDKEGNPNLDATKPIDIYGIKKLVDEILPLLEYSIVEFEEMITPYNEYIKELSADTEREIMSYYF